VCDARTFDSGGYFSLCGIIKEAVVMSLETIEELRKKVVAIGLRIEEIFSRVSKLDCEAQQGLDLEGSEKLAESGAQLWLYSKELTSKIRGQTKHLDKEQEAS
jgi:hypothetical protein